MSATFKFLLPLLMLIHNSKSNIFDLRVKQDIS